jgi:hypothetical protein
VRALLLILGCATTSSRAPLPELPEPAGIRVAIIEMGGNQEAEDGCVRAVLDAGHRPVDKKLLDRVLPNDDDIDYQKLGHALDVALIIDGGLARGMKLVKVLPPRIVSALKGDVLASSRVKKKIDESYRNAREICADLLSQLP